MPLSRREFVTWLGASGIAIGLSRLSPAEALDFDATQTLPGAANAGLARSGRVDGVAKVTGAKIYGSDFRASDIDGWPTHTSHALLVRTPDATHVYEGIDFDALPAGAKPTVVVTAADLDRVGIRVPAFYAGDMFVPVGQTPLYLGQPVALLIFESFDAFDQARVIFRDRNLLKFGAETGPIEQPNYAALRFTRVAGPTPGSPDVYSPLQEGFISPGFDDANGRPIWQPLPTSEGGNYAKGATYGEEIRKLLASGDPGLYVLDRQFQTQSIDPMALEPESGLAWYNSGGKSLELVLGVQSPFEIAEAIDYMIGDTAADFRPGRIHAQFASLGGSFGGRDHTPFPLYVTLAGMFFPGKPVRLAHDRYQQFQGGIKRHAFDMRTRIGIDRATGLMTAFAADHVLDGGGLANYSASVATVGGTAAIGIYDIPKVDVTTVAQHSRGVTAGSMRGYGTLQTMTALETLVDEAATELGIDPIDLRRRNLLRTGGRTMNGNPWTVSVRTPELLDKLEGHAIWRDRAAHKADAPNDVVVGTGVACCVKDYGTGADSSNARVELAPDGTITIHADAVEMGNGVATSMARRVSHALGRMADEVRVADIHAFDELGLVTSGNPYSISQAEQDEASKNPRWVPDISGATSASNGAHVGTQSAAQAARVIFRYGMWPAALALWGIAEDDPRRFLWEEAFWQDNELILSGLPPLAQVAVAAKAHEQGGITGAMAHVFSRWAWAQAAFPLGDGDDWASDMDALAVRRGDGPFAVVDRSFVAYPPTDYNRIGTSFVSGCGTTVRVEIDRTSGAIRIAQAYNVFECGEALEPQLVLGQAQGGFAMGLGYALLEHLPPFEDGPGNGQWNLGQYLVARASDLPMHRLESELLAPVSPKEPPKGIAEVVMIPVVAALLNAIHDATGKRFYSLPVTPEMLQGALS